MWATDRTWFALFVAGGLRKGVSKTNQRGETTECVTGVCVVGQSLLSLSSEFGAQRLHAVIFLNS